jgi:hypothetical protein
MKTKSLLFATWLALSPIASFAATLIATTAVHTKPDEASPAITFLKAGSDPVPAPGFVASTPAGWMAIELPGPFEGYVQNKDLTKSLDVKAGASIYLAPKLDAGVLAFGEKDDKTNVTGLYGKWTQIALNRKLIAYINVGGVPGYVPPIATNPAGGADAAGGVPMAPAPVSPVAYGSAEVGKAAPVVSLPEAANTLPRQFAGRFVSTRSPFHPRRPYDWALNDEAGKRYAYLDISKLLLTDQIEKYTDHKVVVFGPAHATPDGKDIVITIETLELK